MGKAVRLDELAPGTKFRLFRTYRDGSYRPRYKYAKEQLVNHTFELQYAGDTVLGVTEAGLKVPFEPGLKVKL